MSGIPRNTPQGKSERQRQERDNERRVQEEYSDAKELIRQHESSQRSIRGHHNHHYQSNGNDYVSCNLVQSRFDGQSRFDYNTNNSHGNGEVNLHDHALSLKAQTKSISANFTMFTYDPYDESDRPPFDDECHPKKVMEDVFELLDKWTLDMILANGGERLVKDLLRVIPKIIEANNIEDDTANEDDKDVLLKQTELMEAFIKAFDLLLLNQQLGKVLIDHLTNDNYFSQLFYEVGGKEGYKSKHLKNKFSSGLFFSLCDFLTTHSSTIEDADMNKVIKLLEKLSSKNDEPRFGEIGGLSSVYNLLQTNPNEDNKKSLWYIVHDMWKAQQYARSWVRLKDEEEIEKYCFPFCLWRDCKRWVEDRTAHNDSNCDKDNDNDTDDNDNTNTNTKNREVVIKTI